MHNPQETPCLYMSGLHLSCSTEFPAFTVCMAVAEISLLA